MIESDKSNGFFFFLFFSLQKYNLLRVVPSNFPIYIFFSPFGLARSFIFPSSFHLRSDGSQRNRYNGMLPVYWFYFLFTFFLRSFSFWKIIKEKLKKLNNFEYFSFPCFLHQVVPFRVTHFKYWIELIYFTGVIVVFSWSK